MKNLLLLLGLVLVLSFPIQVLSTPSFTVSVDVQADDPELSDALTSYISRELRSLGDVHVVLNGASEHAELVALDVTNKSGLLFGYSVSCVVTSPSSLPSLAPYYLEYTNIVPILLSATNDTRQNLHAVFFLDPGSEGIRAGADRIVTMIDTKVLQEDRRNAEAFERFMATQKPIDNNASSVPATK